MGTGKWVSGTSGSQAEVGTMRILYVVLVTLAGLVLVESAQATSIFLDNCDAQGCQGTTLSLSVVANIGSFDVTLTINSDNYSGTRLGLNQVGFGAIQNWTSVTLDSSPNGSWLNPPVAADVSSNG